VCGVLVVKPEGKRPLVRPRNRWEDNIKIDLQEVGMGAWTGLSWLRIETSGGTIQKFQSVKWSVGSLHIMGRKKALNVLCHVAIRVDL
jgi:hypothetical protein